MGYTPALSSVINTIINKKLMHQDEDFRINVKIREIVCKGKMNDSRYRMQDTRCFWNV